MRARPRRCSQLRSTSASPRVARMSSQPKCCRPCASSSAGMQSVMSDPMDQAEILNQLERPTHRVADPCVMVIFGASGDLTKRKLIPALYNLAKDNLLSRQFAIIGFARPGMSHEQFRDKC